MGRRARRRSNAWSPAVNFVLVIAFVSAAGYFLGRYTMDLIIGPPARNRTSQPATSQPAAGPSNPPSAAGDKRERVAVNWPGFSLYRVQVGSFADREKALALAADLRAHGYPAHVTEAGAYKVLAAMASGKEGLASLSASLARDGYPVYVSTVAISSGTATNEWPSREYAALVQDALARTKDLIAQAGTWWSSYYETGAPPGADATSALATVRPELEKVRDSLGAQSPSEPFSALHARLVRLTSQAIDQALALESAGQTGGWSAGYRAASEQYMQLVDAYSSLVKFVGQQA